MAIVEFGELKVELRQATNADARERERIVRILATHYSTTDADLIFGFRILGRMITQSVTAENLPFSLSRTMTEPEIVRAWECFDLMPEGFTDELWGSFADLLKPLDRATAPEPLPEDADPKARRGGK